MTSEQLIAELDRLRAAAVEIQNSGTQTTEVPRPMTSDDVIVEVLRRRHDIHGYKAFEACEIEADLTDAERDVVGLRATGRPAENGRRPLARTISNRLLAAIEIKGQTGPKRQLLPGGWIVAKLGMLGPTQSYAFLALPPGCDPFDEKGAA